MGRNDGLAGARGKLAIKLHIRLIARIGNIVKKIISGFFQKSLRPGWVGFPWGQVRERQRQDPGFKKRNPGHPARSME